MTAALDGLRQERQDKQQQSSIKQGTPANRGGGSGDGGVAVAVALVVVVVVVVVAVAARGYAVHVTV